MGFELQITIILLIFQLSYAQIQVGFYKGKCGSNNVEKIVFETLQNHTKIDKTIAPRMVRLFFHDCFVQGCDASILLAGTNAERTAAPNLSLLDAFPAIDDAKAQLEALCPGVVSCADIIALAARDSVILTQNPTGFFGVGVPISYDVKTGRKDGKVSLASNTANLPAPTDSVKTQIQKFSEKNLTPHDLVTLVGAHTIGASRCQFFSYRLYNYSGTGKPDPSINTNILTTLQGLCPNIGANTTLRVPLDDSPDKFDNTYFMNLRDGQGVLESDQVLLSDAMTKLTVQRYYVLGGLIGGLDFKREFGKSMIKMGDIGVLTGNDGEIRRVCNATN